jgi:hypothetical protein
MDEKCPGGYKIITVFSHVQTVLLRAGCSTVQCSAYRRSQAQGRLLFWKKETLLTYESVNLCFLIESLSRII